MCAQMRESKRILGFSWIRRIQDLQRIRPCESWILRIQGVRWIRGSMWIHGFADPGFAKVSHLCESWIRRISINANPWSSLTRIYASPCESRIRKNRVLRIQIRRLCESNCESHNFWVQCRLIFLYPISENALYNARKCTRKISLKNAQGWRKFSKIYKKTPVRKHHFLIGILKNDSRVDVNFWEVGEK